MDQLPPPLMIVLDGTWDTKGRYGPVFYFQKGAGSDLFCSIKLCFHRRGIQPKIAVIFWGTGGSIVDFNKQDNGDDILLFWKIRLGKTEELSLGGKTHIHSR